MAGERCPCGEQGVLGVRLEQAVEHIRELKEVTFGNGRPGLKERVQTVEQTLKGMEAIAERAEDAAASARSDFRKALFAAAGSLAVMVIAFVAAQIWNSRQASDTAQVVRETIRQMAATGSTDVHGPTRTDTDK